MLYEVITKFVICNADEGDPGAYKDRTIMEGNPFKLFEGIVMAGYAIGSHQGLIYLREEYPHTYEFLNDAIYIARRYGLLGKNILGSGFNFTLNIVRGGGSYVCGEETALMDSLEGDVGDPRLRPPFPVITSYSIHYTKLYDILDCLRQPCLPHVKLK